MEVNRIYNENCLETLRRMPDAFIDCLVTSPPYYGLRSYGTEPQVWGGDEDCVHSWGSDLKNPKADMRSPELKASQGATVGSNVASLHWSNGNLGNFCQHCNAWRGELGLEPTFQLYISHLIDIFREAKRALKPTGTVWVNLGDSYGGSASGGGYSDKSTLAGFTSENTKGRRMNDIKVSRKATLAKSLMNIPSRFAIAMTDELQFIQRNKINWWKRACMPSSAKDRFTVDFEDIFFFAKNPKYYFEQQFEDLATSTLNDFRLKSETWTENRPDRDYAGSAQRGSGMLKPTGRMAKGGDGSGELDNSVRFGHSEQLGRNMRTTWDIPFEPTSDEHYAAYPTKLVERMIRAGCPEGGLVYDPFGGTATTAVTAHKLGRNWICSELQPKYVGIAERRMEPYLAQENLF